MSYCRWGQGSDVYVYHSVAADQVRGLVRGARGRTMNNAINIIFDGPPSHESGRFIEVEDDAGHGLRAGEWVERPDGLWALRIAGDVELHAKLAEADRESAALRSRLAEALDLLRIAADRADSSDWWGDEEFPLVADHTDWNERAEALLAREGR